MIEYVGRRPAGADLRVRDPLTPDEFGEGHYVWLRRGGPVIRQVVGLLRALAEEGSAAIQRWLRAGFASLSSGAVLDEHGCARVMPRIWAEDLSAWRRRLASPFSWKRQIGQLVGLFRAFEAIGVQAQGVHAFVAERAAWGASAINSIRIYPIAAVEGDPTLFDPSSLRWLIRIRRADDSEDSYYYDDGWEWTDPTAENIAAHGNTAAEIEAISSEELSVLLPCGEIALITHLGNEQWWAHPGLLADLDITYYD